MIFFLPCPIQVIEALCGFIDMINVTDEIQKAIDTLGLSENDYRKMTEDVSGNLINDFVETFVDGGDRKWWWEAFKIKPIHRITSHPNPFRLIVPIVPDPSEKLWFVVEDDSSLHYPVYEANARVIEKVIGECFGFEYYLIPKDKQWLLCENHHNVLIGIGKQIENGFIKHAT